MQKPIFTGDGYSRFCLQTQDHRYIMCIGKQYNSMCPKATEHIDNISIKPQSYFHSRTVISQKSLNAVIHNKAISVPEIICRKILKW